MLYHASPVANIQILEPRRSNHGTAQVYFSEKRENVLVYLSNAIQKHCQAVGFAHSGVYTTWASYGFTKEGILRLEEYYPNATEETYKGVSGWIYQAAAMQAEKLADIPFVYTSAQPVPVAGCEFVADAYEAILEAAEQGKLILQRFEENSPAKLDWIKRIVKQEYAQAGDQPDYRLFLEAKFGEILKGESYED